MKADFHIHSEYSMDCQTPLRKIIERCQTLELGCIALADHGTAEGGLALKKIAPFKVIVAEEILTPEGEIMGMFLKESIPTNISVEEAIAHIREQDGIVCIPHPFDRMRSSAMNGESLERIADRIDVLEVFNSRSPVSKGDNRAREFADRYGIPGSAGSDAHTPNEIGNAYIEMDDFETKEEFLASLARGTVYGHKSSPFAHFFSTWAKVKKRL